MLPLLNRVFPMCWNRMLALQHRSERNGVLALHDRVFALHDGVLSLRRAIRHVDWRWSLHIPAAPFVASAIVADQKLRHGRRARPARDRTWRRRRAVRSRPWTRRSPGSRFELVGTREHAVRQSSVSSRTGYGKPPQGVDPKWSVLRNPLIALLPERDGILKGREQSERVEAITPNGAHPSNLSFGVSTIAQPADPTSVGHIVSKKDAAIRNPVRDGWVQPDCALDGAEKFVRNQRSFRRLLGQQLDGDEHTAGSQCSMRVVVGSHPIEIMPGRRPGRAFEFRIDADRSVFVSEISEVV